MMTSRAQEIGCTDTVFLTPHGLPMDGHFTTARDLALITREAMQHPFFLELVSTQRATIPWEGRAYDRVLNNKNRLLSTYEGATGVKTGSTKKAGRCLVFSAARNGMSLIGVVLNCPDWFNEAARLMDVAFDRYEAVTMLKAGDIVGQVDVLHSECDHIEAILPDDLTGVAPRGAVPQLEIDLPETLEAPVTAGLPVGTVRLICGGVTIAEVPLLAGQTASRDDFLARWERFWQNWLLTE